ncbi:MAG: hypothetical protein OEX19_12350 [Gammaproteobacteria bacterium]|nr:hypothetical protein [Gammaproteobacteria bacterium]
MPEPTILKRGKLFHKLVQDDFERTSKDGKVNIEHSIHLIHRSKRGRLDLLVDELGDFVSIIEIKSTHWDEIKPKNLTRLLGAHRRQVWRYIEQYIDVEKIDVSPAIIYPKAPTTSGLKDKIITYLHDYGIQVVWFAETNSNERV